jgi:O-antigen/teichoic acid export membrane protein/O-antigen ligase
MIDTITKSPEQPSVFKPAAVKPPRSTALLVVQMFVVMLAVLPARLVIGPLGAFGSPASVVGLAAFGLWASSSMQPELLPRKVVPLRVAIAVFWLPGLISYAVMHLNVRDTDEVNAADRWLLFMLAWTGVALLAAEGLRNRDEVLRVLRVAVAGTAFSSIVAILQARLGFDYTTHIAKLPGLSVAGTLDSVLQRAGLNRPAGTATHPIEFGCVLAMALGPALVLAQHDRSQSKTRRYFALAVIAMGVPLAVSRSAIVNALIVAAFWFAAASRPQRVRGAVAGAALAVAVFLTSPGLIGTLRQYFGSVGTDDSITTRTDDYAAVAHYIRHSPLIGRGPMTFLPKYRILDNQFLGQLIETGIIGTVALLAYLMLPWIIGRKIKLDSSDDFGRQLGQAFVGIAAVAIFASTTFDSFSFPTMPGYLAVYIGAATAWLTIGRPRVNRVAPAFVGVSPFSAQRAPSTRGALKWSVVAQFVARAGSFTLGLVLARLLSPENFGVYTVALGVFLLLLTIDDLGMLKALVRWPGSFAEAAPTARTLATMSAAGVYALAFMLAPAIAHVTGTTAATTPIRVLCLGILLDAVLQIVPGASLQRDLRQDLWVIIEVTRLAVTAFVTVPLAARGGGVWALVIGALCGQLAGVLANIACAPIPFQYGYDRRIARQLLRVSVPYALAALVSAALLNVDYLAIGSVLGPTAVGLYLVAFNVSSWPNSLIGAAVRSVAIPSFSRLHHDGSGVSRSLNYGLAMLYAGAVPFAAILIAVPNEVVGALYGERWVPGAIALPFLAVMSLVRLLDGLSDDALFATGRSSWLLLKNTCWLVALLIGLPLAAHVDGIRGVGIGQAVAVTALVVPITVTFLIRSKLWQSRLIVTLLALTAAGAIAAACAAIVSRRVDAPPFIDAAVATLVVVVVYGALVFPLRRRVLRRP